MTTPGDRLRLYRSDPRICVREVFGATPDAWQDEALEAFPHQQRMALKACKGPGKTAFLAWAIWNYLLTRPHPKVACVSITSDNLADGLWTELAKWRARSPLLTEMFEWTKTRIFSKQFPETWFAAARSFPKTGSSQDQADALAGLHADYMLFVLDETGSMPDAVMATAEASLSGCIEGHIVQAGNPTRLEGPLYRAHKDRDAWWVIEITGDPDDPKRTKRMPVEWARQQIKQWGREHPYVLVNVFGQFPPSSFNTLISMETIEAACLRSYRPEDISRSARVLGVDVARQGDDASVIWPRQGLVAFAPFVYRNLNSVQGAAQVHRKWGDWDADAVFIDDTGGYGAGWIDQLRVLGRAAIGVPFSGSPDDDQYANKRAEIYFRAAEWIKGGGQLPPMTTPGMHELATAMSRTTYTHPKSSDKLLLEPKDLVKDRIGYSPDHADAFALSFTQPHMTRKGQAARGRGQHAYEYDPFAEFSRMPAPRHVAAYDPFGGPH